MSLREMQESEKDILNQLSGLTGLGWTTSLLGYLSMVLGYSNSILIRIADPQSLLYLGVCFFLTTLGIDRLRNRRSDGKD